MIPDSSHDIEPNLQIPLGINVQSFQMMNNLNYSFYPFLCSCLIYPKTSLMNDNTQSFNQNINIQESKDKMIECFAQNQQNEKLKNEHPHISNNLDQKNVKKSDSCKKNHRIHFTRDEDDRIKYLVQKYGSKNWAVIASFMKGKSAKQCRDRYSNYLIPGYFHGEWSKEEDELLEKLHKEYGTKWSLIQKHLTHRSPNAIKNRWHYFLNKEKDKNDKASNNSANDEIFNEKKTQHVEIEPKNKYEDLFKDDVTDSFNSCDFSFDEWINYC